jgi:hypothetical protein
MAILLPTSLVVFSAEWPLFAVTNRVNSVRRDASSGQRVSYCIRTAVTECDVVLYGTPLVTVAFDCELEIRMLREECRVRLHGCLLVCADVGFVKIKVDIFDVLVEQILIGNRWAAAGGGGGCVTVSRVVASCVPPAPLAVKRYVVDWVGDTVCEPLAGTAPTPSIETSVALVVCQFSEADPPTRMSVGSTEIEAVGAGGGGGRGGGAGATFFLQAPNIMMAPRATAVTKYFDRCVILNFSYQCKKSSSPLF